MAKKVAKNLPYNPDAERACLGSALLNKDACLDVVNSFTEEEFFEGKHQLIFRAIRSLTEKNIPVDVLTVAEELTNMKELENIGGVEYLQECSDSMVTITALDFYIRIVQNQAVLRNFLITMRDIDQRYHNEEIADVDEFVSDSKNRIETVLEKRRISNFSATKDIVRKVEANIKKLADAGNVDDIIGISSGYKNINFLTQGFKKGEMVIVAARPSVGKTALCLNFAYNIAIDGGKPVGIFSLEMSNELLCQRLLGIASCVPVKYIMTGKLNNSQKMDLGVAIDKLETAPIYIDDTSGNKMTDIITKSRKLKTHEPNLGAIIIDYLGLIQSSSSSRNADSRQEEVRKISLAIKALAKDLDVPIIVVSQLSRDVEKRGGDNRPMLSDLRDSGSLEQDADIVMLLYREDYYKQNENPEAAFKKGGKLSNQDKYELVKAQKQKELGEKIPGNASYVEVNVAKNRNGRTGKAPLFFYKDFSRFDEPGEEWENAMREIENEANNN